MNFHNISRRLGAALSALLLAGTLSAAAAVNSGNPALSDLEIRANGVNLINFDPSTTSYSIEVEDVSMITLSAAPQASDATVDITVNGRAYDNHSLSSLDGGENVIVYTVKSAGSERAYTINVKTPLVVRSEHFSWKNATIYFVITDRFYNGDTSNDKSYHRQRGDNFRHHISQLGIVGQQLVNKIDDSMLDLKILSRAVSNLQLSTALYVVATFIYYLMFVFLLL